LADLSSQEREQYIPTRIEADVRAQLERLLSFDDDAVSGPLRKAISDLAGESSRMEERLQAAGAVPTGCSI